MSIRTLLGSMLAGALGLAVPATTMAQTQTPTPPADQATPPAHDQTENRAHDQMQEIGRAHV